MNNVQSKRKRKTLQELTFKSGFMFAAVMQDADIAKAVLELVLGVKVKSIRVIPEKSLVYNPEYKGVRLDVEIEDENHTHYDVEMQVADKKIFKRARYYHDQIDMDLLLRGEGYGELPDAYVIFICDFDPVGLKKYKYTRRQTLKEDGGYDYDDGSHTVFLSTKGENDREVPEELVKFLKFVGANLEESQRNYEDTLVKRLQESVERVKRDREMGMHFMTMEELMMEEEFEAGKAEGIVMGKASGIIELLEELAPISDNLKERISSIEDMDILSELLKKSARIKSIEEFESYLNQKNL